MSEEPMAARMAPMSDPSSLPEGVRGANAFVGSIPETYERHLVPWMFAPYAADLAERLAGLQAGALLEVAAGTGAVTRQLAAQLPEAVRIVATDLNQPMLDRAEATGTARAVEWRQADVQHLPFADDTFDAAVCQFGVMFFPDRAAAFAELHRVLRPGGRLLFNVWGPLQDNDVFATVVGAVAAAFPDDPPAFADRVPYGYHDRTRIAADLRAGGFAADPQIDVVDARARAGRAADMAIGICGGTPLRNEIEARDASRFDEIVERATAALVRRFGDHGVDGALRALVVTVDAS
jgi:SAM-dependent methyltransferase